MSASPLLTFRIFQHRCPAASARLGFQTHSVSSWRSFSLSAPRCKLSAKAPKSPSRHSAQAKPAEKRPQFAERRPPGLGKLASKVAREGKVELHRAPSHRSYILSAYTLSALCFSWSIYHSNAIFRDPLLPLPTWQKVLYGGICMVTTIMGTLFFIRTRNLIKKITAISVNGRTQLQFTVRRLVPLMKPYQFQALPSQVTFKRQLVLSPESMRRYQTDQTRIGAGQGPSPRFFKAPLKTLNVAFWRVFQSMRQIFTNEDFILMEVQGQKGALRMDSNGVVAQELLLIGDPVNRRTMQ